MKKLLFLSTIIMVMLSCIAFISCAEDDDEEKTEKPDTPDTPDKPDTKTDESVKLGYCPDTKHPHLIDLGNGMLWSCCNVGAKTPSDHGGFYAWGETKEKTKYDITTYDYCDKKNEDSYWDLEQMFGSRGIYAPHTYSISATVFDVAYVKMGKQWMMPNSTDVNKLQSKSTSEAATLNGVHGCKIKGENGKSIFLPEGGAIIGDIPKDFGWLGEFWCGDRDTGYDHFGEEDSAYSFDFTFYNGIHDHPEYGLAYYDYRPMGNMVRPIKNSIN